MQGAHNAFSFCGKSIRNQGRFLIDRKEMLVL